MISLIAAMSENRVIGNENRLPWHLPEDLKRFRKLTEGHPVILGRKTFESIGRLLPKRLNIIVTRNPDFKIDSPEEHLIVHSLEDALTAAVQAAEKSADPEVFILGGAEIYRQAMPLADRIYLTLVHQQIEGDASFPVFSPNEYREVSRERHEGNPAFSFLLLEKAGR